MRLYCIQDCTFQKHSAMCLSIQGCQDTAAQDGFKLALSEAITFAHWVLVVHLEGTDNMISAEEIIYHAYRCIMDRFISYYMLLLSDLILFS